MKWGEEREREKIRESDGAFIAHFEFLLTVYRTFRVSSFYVDRLVEMKEGITSTSKKFEMKRRNVKCSGPSNRETLQMLKFDWNGHSVTTRYKRSSSSPCRVSHWSSLHFTFRLFISSFLLALVISLLTRNPSHLIVAIRFERWLIWKLMKSIVRNHFQILRNDVFTLRA